MITRKSKLGVAPVPIYKRPHVGWLVSHAVSRRLFHDEIPKDVTLTLDPITGFLYPLNIGCPLTAFHMTRLTYVGEFMTTGRPFLALTLNLPCACTRLIRLRVRYILLHGPPSL